MTVGQSQLDTDFGLKKSVLSGVTTYSINIFYCIILYGNGVGPQVLPTLVTALPLEV